MDTRSRVHRSASKPNPYAEQLKTNLDIAKAKRARILKLIHELNSFKHFMSTKERDDEVAESIGSLHQQLCAEVKTEAKEVEETSKQIQNNVMHAKPHVEDLLRDLLTAVGPTPGVIHNLPELVEINKKQANISRNITTKSPTVQSPTPPVRVAGHVNKERCGLCEELDNEEVCGDNGKTYRTMCHAINCAGLALRDVAAGACVTKVNCCGIINIIRDYYDSNRMCVLIPSVEVTRYVFHWSMVHALLYTPMTDI